MGTVMEGALGIAAVLLLIVITAALILASARGKVE